MSCVAPVLKFGPTPLNTGFMSSVQYEMTVAK
jgi:hypothetical protein